MDTATIALALGDRYGIGPEIVAKFISSSTPSESIQIVIVGDRRVLEAGRRVAAVDFPYEVIGSFAEANKPGASWLFLDCPQPEMSLEPVGRNSAESGKEVLSILTFLVENASAGAIDGIVYAPLNKLSMKMAGMTKGDELSFILDLLEFEGKAGELNILNGCWTSRVTSHVPLRKVADGITKDSVLAAIELIHRSLIGAGVESPKIAVAGLNPHAGDGGAFGDEEIEMIEPAVRAARSAGVDVHGPFSPDTVFLQAKAGGYQAVVSMYHDQGQIAMKLMGFEEGVTLLGGLPFPVATPAHGTAFDIAGKGIAKSGALAAAMRVCTKIALGRQSRTPHLNYQRRPERGQQ